MKQLKILFSILLSFFFLEGCATKNYTKEERIFLIFKTQMIKYADLAFMYKGQEKIKIQMYSNGQALKTLEIDTQRVCLSLFECLDKEAFNQKFLSPYYPKDILSQVLKGEAIFSAKNRINEVNGFRQTLMSAGKYDITYSVLADKIYFYDRLNFIKIKLRRLK